MQTNIINPIKLVRMSATEGIVSVICSQTHTSKELWIDMISQIISYKCVSEDILQGISKVYMFLLQTMHQINFQIGQHVHCSPITDTSSAVAITLVKTVYRIVTVSIKRENKMDHN